MNRAIISLSLVILALAAFSSSTLAQRSPTPAIDRDPVLEQDAKHNLDVAWQAFGPARKAYKQVLGRFEETYAAYPDFSKMDEFLYLAGMSSYYLSENKGKQKLDLKSAKDKDKYSPEKLKENAVAYLSAIVDKYSDSKYRAEAESTLKLLKDEK